MRSNKLLEASANIDSVANEITDYTRNLGEYCGYERISIRDITNGLTMHSYLIKYKSSPIRFTFIFYKPNDSWVLQSFLYDNDIMEEVKEMRKVYWLDDNSRTE